MMAEKLFCRETSKVGRVTARIKPRGVTQAAVPQLPGVSGYPSHWSGGYRDANLVANMIVAFVARQRQAAASSHRGPASE